MTAELEKLFDTVAQYSLTRLRKYQSLVGREVLRGTLLEPVDTQTPLAMLAKLWLVQHRRANKQRKSMMTP